MKKSLSNFKENIVKAGAIVLALVFVALAVLEGTKSAFAGGYEDAGPGDYDTSACTTGICWNLRKRGAFWVKIPVSSNGVKASQLGFDYIFRNDTIDCYDEATGQGAVYVLATRLSNGGIAGMVNIDDATSRGGVNDGDGGRAPGEITPEATAHNDFNKNADGYWNDYQQRYSGTGLAYFCAEKTSKSSKKTTTHTPDGRKLKCGAYQTNPKADTESRIAVQNMHLDGDYNPTDSSGNPVRWRANGSRSGITSDSMYDRFSRGKGSIYTLAKPGDSIRFYHGICMAVRYGRWTPTQDSWVSAQSHSNKYTPLPNNWMTIGADSPVYVFEQKSVWNNFANKVRTVSALEKPLFSSSAGAGSEVNADKNAIDIINPTPGYSGHTCKMAWTADPKSGGYQIPGFSTGSCPSQGYTGIGYAVGTIISQYHKFNPLRMWETKSHTRSGSCGCGVNDAVLVGNYTDSTYDASWTGSELGNRKEWKCKSKTTKDCDWICTAHHPVYGYCTAGYYNKINYPYTDDSFKLLYHSSHEGQGETSEKWASVYVPFNFTTSTYSQINAGDVTFQGAAIATHYEWSVNRRKNDKTAPELGSGYATVTPGRTKVVMFEWLYTPGSHKITGNEFSNQGPQSYYSSGMVPGTYKEVEVVNGDQNPTGNYAGASHEKNHSRTVPDNDEYVGYKYCTAIAFYPSDSHNNGGNSLGIQRGVAMTAGDKWNISGASCRTIAKKPNFQVWNGSIYTGGSINTSITRKWTTKSIGREYQGGQADIFGSWADYAIVAKGNNKTMASGAMLGYENSRYDLAGNGGKKRSTVTPQKINPETTANNSDPTGHSGIDASASYTQNLARLDSRYKDKAKTLLKEIGHNSTENRIYTTKTGMQVAHVADGKSLSSLSVASSSNPNSGTLTNNGNGLIKRLGDGTNDNTLVIVSDGTFTIDRNICYGNSCGSDATKLATYASGTSTKKAATLPQVLIFANNIKIAEDVTRVDAWLISPSGTLNTCANHKIGRDSGSTIGLVARDAHARPYTTGNCGKTLVVNGPVFAKHIDLLRTAGAFHGYADTTNSSVLNRSIGATGDGATDAKKGSVAPAEIFNLRSDVYIWAYNQAERYSEAVVTYMRELAPRY